MNTLTSAPSLLDFNVSADALDGVCPMTTLPTHSTISSLSIMATVRDPHNRLHDASRLVRGKHPDSTTETTGPKDVYIQSPSEEIGFHGGSYTGDSATTNISLTIRDPWLLFGQMLDGGLVDVDGGRQPLTLELALLHLRQRIHSLVGFQSLVADPDLEPPALSTFVASLVTRLGDHLHNPLRLNAAIEGYREEMVCLDIHRIDEIRAHAIRQYRLRLDDFLPLDVNGMSQSYRAFKDAWPQRPVSAPARSGWSLSASRDPYAQA